MLEEEKVNPKPKQLFLFIIYRDQFHKFVIFYKK